MTITGEKIKNEEIDDEVEDIETSYSESGNNDITIEDDENYYNNDYPTLSDRDSIPYEDRDLSWIKFNERVLSLSSNPSTPLMERVKFLSIANSNLDEFFSIRVAARMNADNDDMNNKVKLIDIVKKCNSLCENIDKTYINIMNELSIQGINVSQDAYHFNEEDEQVRSKIVKYFNNNIKPALTPLIIDSTRPLPHIKPFCIYIACVIKVDDCDRIGLVEIPPQLDRMIKIKKVWYFIEDIITLFLSELYPGINYTDTVAFRLLRDGDSVDFDEEFGYVDNMLKHVRRRILYNDPVRLEVYGNNSKDIVNILKSSLKIQKKFIFRTSTRLKMADIMDIYTDSGNEFKYPEFKPVSRIGEDIQIMDKMEDGDFIIHHPYESFNDSVLRLIKEASNDPDVISIKMTIYRSGSDSKILKYLLHAAELGKNVTALVELKARYNESDNIEIAEKLQKAGANVIYGFEQIKTHAKLIHIFKKKGKEVIQYGQIGTGNYSEKNSKIYTDFSYFTCNNKICTDISNVFAMLTGGYVSESVKFDRLKVAPLYIRPTLYQLIDEEIDKGTDGYIAIKTNNISDVEIVDRLYMASKAGVKIDIICRGSCSLIAGVAGYSENITVKSIVGRFLEHSRMFIFGKQDSKVFITSADLMTRNLNRRVEILYEIRPNEIKSYMKNYFNIMLSDVSNSYYMNSDASYMYTGDSVVNFADNELINSQEHLISMHKIMSARL